IVPPPAPRGPCAQGWALQLAVTRSAYGKARRERPRRPNRDPCCPGSRGPWDRARRGGSSMDVYEWLMDSDPAIRWQVMRDLAHASDESVAAERARVATEGWGARLLALQDEDGQWGGDALPAEGRSETGLPSPATRRLLRELDGGSLAGLGGFLRVGADTLAAWGAGEPGAPGGRDGQWGRDALPAEGRSETGLPSPATRRLLRELHGVSLADLAGFLGVEADTLAAWESGEPDATDERAARYGSVVAWMWNLGTLKPEWTATTYSLLLLRDMGLDPRSEQARRAVALVRDNVKWDHDGQDFFDGEVEPCINGKAVALGAYFGEDVDGIVTRLLAEQLEDGGWNCESENGSVRSSFHTTIDVLDGLLEYEQAGGAIDVTEARLRAQE